MSTAAGLPSIAPWKAWVLAFRPKTLTAALVPIVAATALVQFEGRAFDWSLPVLALLASFFIQIGTNLINDAVDFGRGADTDERIGPMRVTQKGLFTARQVWLAGSLFFGLAVLCGIPLVLQGGWPIVMIGLMSVLFGYAYTAGPYPLAYLGLGDVFVILFFGLIAVGGLTFILTGEWQVPAFVLGLQIGLHATVMIAINNLRDIHQDVKVHKKTLPVRFGQKFAKTEITVLILAPFLINLYWWGQAGPWAALLPLITLPLALKIVTLVSKNEPSPAYNRFLAMSAGLHLLFGCLLSLGLVLCSNFGPISTPFSP
ncbi:MAG: 1,4-dihydroxy-2-naphthoate polyprenyltransferase [Bdellovibrionaceae bacterium]|nr:1,4-dihydroxy-2-naphthoate polyprenyltransferase [Pseudobdellovibrionaceae bacterium]